MKHSLIKRLHLSCSAAEAFAWHESPGALEKLIPPGDPVRVVEHQPGLQGPIGDGARVLFELGKRPLSIRWIAVHEGYIAGQQFVDVQVKGPFAFWRHTHRFFAENDGSCTLEDHVEYLLPGRALGNLVAHKYVRGQLERMFAWRHRATFEALTSAHE